MATVILQLLVFATYTAVAATTKSPMSPAQSSDISFLRRSCGITRRPDTCYNLLLPNVSSFHGSLARVAREATTIAAAKQHRFGEDLTHLKLQGTGAGRVADMTVVSCYDMVSSSDKYANKTLGHLNNLVSGVKNKRDFSSEKHEAINWIGVAGSGMMMCEDWFNAAGEEALSKKTVTKVVASCNDVSTYLEIAIYLVTALKF
ncbi:hypothetical protein QOZ80_3AG0224870 [Eleusine coracana subsp. coracana]|nr:hypothetical protein QOZ80_3AG0224870 [Eleusine coracana subsp. coracana]